MHIASSEPAIKHAVLGLTALHLRFIGSNTLPFVDDDISYALSHYTKSISHLRESMKTVSTSFPDLPLVACILYCVFESMSYHLQSAVSHAESGIKMFAESQRCPLTSTPRSIPTSTLSVLYTNLDTQGLELGETSLSRPKYVQRPKGNGRSLFSNIDEAQTSFDELTNAILHATHGSRRENSFAPHGRNSGNTIAEVVLRDLVESFQCWCHTFDSFVLQDCNKVNLAPCLLLQIWRILVIINLSVDLQLLSLAFILAQPRTSVGVKDSLHLVVPLETPKFHRLKWSGDGTRGVYLGVHSRCTPLASDQDFDLYALQQTTERLLRLSQSLRPRQTQPARLEDFACLPYAFELTYCFSPGTVSPLFVFMTRCRDPRIRRRTLSLMQRCNDGSVCGIQIWPFDLAGVLSESKSSVQQTLMA